MNPWRKLLSLSPGETRLLAAAACSVLLAELAIRLPPPVIFLRLLQHRKPTTTTPDSPAVEALDRFVDIANRHAPGTRSCLRRAMALGYSCRWHGIDAALCIGVRQERGTLHAHAWVRTGDGHAFGFSEEPEYEPLSRSSGPLDSYAGMS